jgi:hypothetical protein
VRLEIDLAFPTCNAAPHCSRSAFCSCFLLLQWKTQRAAFRMMRAIRSSLFELSGWFELKITACAAAFHCAIWFLLPVAFFLAQHFYFVCARSRQVTPAITQNKQKHGRNELNLDDTPTKFALLGNGSKMARESASVNISLPPNLRLCFKKEFHLREELKGGKKCSKSSKEL